MADYLPVRYFQHDTLRYFFDYFQSLTTRSVLKNKRLKHLSRSIGCVALTSFLAPSVSAQVCEAPNNLLASAADVSRNSGTPSLSAPWEPIHAPAAVQYSDGYFEISDNLAAATAGISQMVYFDSSEQFITAQIRVPMTESPSTFPGMTILMSGGADNLITINTENCTANFFHNVHEPYDFGSVDEGSVCRVWLTAENLTSTTSAKFRVFATPSNGSGWAWSGQNTGTQLFRDPLVELSNGPSDVTPKAIAGSDEAGIVVRQYTGNARMTALLANPGPDVTGILVVSYADEATNLEPTVATELATVRANGLKAYAGFRIGRLNNTNGNGTPDGWNCTTQSHWQNLAALLEAIVALTAEDEMIVFDGESYKPGEDSECTDTFIAAHAVDYNGLLHAMAPFLDVIKANKLRVGFYPANAEDASMRAIFDAAGDGSEAWSERFWDQTNRFNLNPHQFLIRERVANGWWHAIEERHPNVHVRAGYYDDLLRDWGTAFRNSNDRRARAWVFDYTRVDVNDWGTTDWLDGTSMSDLNDGVVNAWAMHTMNGFGNFGDPLPDRVSGEPLLKKWSSTGEAAAGSNPIGMVRTTGWGPGLEWSGKAVVQDPPPVAQTFMVTVTLDVKTEDRALISMWRGDSSNNSFRLWLQNGEIVLDVWLADNTTERLVIDANPPVGESLTYVFGFDATRIRFLGQSADKTGLSASPKTWHIFRAGLLKNTNIFMGDVVFRSSIIRWNRLLDIADMADAAADNQYPFNHGGG